MQLKVGEFNVEYSTSNVTGNPFIVATGGSGNTLTVTCGNFKIATFTGPGDFTVSQVHPCAANNVVILYGSRRWWRWWRR